MVLRSFALADPEIRERAETMLREHGTDAARRAVEHLDAAIRDGNLEGRDMWAQIFHAINVLTRQPAEEGPSPSSPPDVPRD